MFHLGGISRYFVSLSSRAEKSVDDHMTLPIHEGWTEKEIDDMIKALEKVEKYHLKKGRKNELVGKRTFEDF